MADHRFCCVDGDIFHVTLKNTLDSNEFAKIASWGRCRMGIDVIDLFFRDACVFDSESHAFSYASAIFSWAGDMIGITVDSTAEIFAIDRRSTSKGMF